MTTVSQQGGGWKVKKIVICLASKYEKYDDDNCIIAGWGLEGKKMGRGMQKGP